MYMFYLPVGVRVLVLRMRHELKGDVKVYAHAARYAKD